MKHYSEQQEIFGLDHKIIIATYVVCVVVFIGLLAIGVGMVSSYLTGA